MSYFEEDVPRRPEIVAGLFREGQIVTLAGSYNVGKTPLLADLNLCIAKGISWCGREVRKRRVLHLDFESSQPDFVNNYRNIAKAQKVDVPTVPEEIVPFLYNATITDPRTVQLVNAAVNHRKAFEFLATQLEQNPESHICCDPMEMLFPDMRMNNGEDVSKLYKGLRQLFSKYHHASIMFSSNLRKGDRRAVDKPDLLKDPHSWLQEISGSNNLLNRSDARWGMDRYGDDIRIVNGVRRGEDAFPLLLLPVDDDPERLGGFRLSSATDGDLQHVLTEKQFNYYHKLPASFHFNEVAGNGCPRVTLHRIIKAAESIGRIKKDEKEIYTKL